MFKKAVPIWAKDFTDERNILLEFTKDVDFSGKFIKIRIAADALYRMYINGKLIAHGPQRAGKGFWRVDEIDLTHKINRGENNHIAIQVERFGVMSFEYVLQPSFLMAEVEMDGNVIASTGVDGDFTARRVLSKKQLVERYSYQRPFIEVWNLPMEYSDELSLVKVDNIELKERTAPYPIYKEMLFNKLIARGTENVNLKPEYHENLRLSTDKPIFSYKDSEIGVLYRDILYEITLKNIEHYEKELNDYSFILRNSEFESFRLPYENTGFIKCTVECSEDSIVFFIYDEILCNDDVSPLDHYKGSVNVIPVNMKAGKYDIISLEPRTMQYLKVLCVEGNVKISELKLVEYVNSMANTAKFECDDEALMRIYQAAVQTFEQYAVDIFMDCPSRERAGGLCDSFFTGRVEKDITGQSGVEK